MIMPNCPCGGGIPPVRRRSDRGVTQPLFASPPRAHRAADGSDGPAALPGRRPVCDARAGPVARAPRRTAEPRATSYFLLALAAAGFFSLTGLLPGRRAMLW
jgi:hypothetical protein